LGNRKATVEHFGLNLKVIGPSGGSDVNKDLGHRSQGQGLGVSRPRTWVPRPRPRTNITVWRYGQVDPQSDRPTMLDVLRINTHLPVLTRGWVKTQQNDGFTSEN